MILRDLHIIIPFYNEAKRFHYFSKPMVAFLEANRDKMAGLTLVNDGSTDDTLDKLELFASQYPKIAKVVSYSKNSGKGFALKKGVEAAKSGSWLLFADADLQIPVEQVLEWEDFGWIKDNNTLYTGDRELGKERDWVQYSALRTFAGKIFVGFVRLFTGLKLRDSQCGYKLIPFDEGKSIFANLQEFSFAFDVEVLARAKQKSLPIVPLAVRCKTVEGSRVSVIRDGWKMFWALFRIRNRIKKEAASN